MFRDHLIPLCIVHRLSTLSGLQGTLRACDRLDRVLLMKVDVGETRRCCRPLGVIEAATGRRRRGVGSTDGCLRGRPGVAADGGAGVPADADDWLLLRVMSPMGVWAAPNVFPSPPDLWPFHDTLPPSLPPARSALSLAAPAQSGGRLRCALGRRGAERPPSGAEPVMARRRPNPSTLYSHPNCHNHP